MKKILYLSVSIIIILTVGVYLQSSDEPQDTPKEALEPIATVLSTKQLLKKLEGQIILFQKINSDQSERLAGVFANWKRAGKIKQAEQWNQVRNGINDLLSTIQLILNDFERVEKLRKNEGLIIALQALEKESQKFTPEKMSDTRFLMQSASLYGKRIFEDKLLDKLKNETEVVFKEKEPAEVSVDSEFPSYDSTSEFFDYGSDSDFDDDFGFDSGFDTDFDFDTDNYDFSIFGLDY